MRHLLVVLLRSEGEEVERVGLVAPGFVHVERRGEELVFVYPGGERTAVRPKDSVEALDRIENAFRVGLAEAFIEV
jgi:hypothetical protein